MPLYTEKEEGGNGLRIGLGLGLGPGNAILLFFYVSSVTSYEYLTKTVLNMVNLVRPVKIYTAASACFSVLSGVRFFFVFCFCSC